MPELKLRLRPTAMVDLASVRDYDAHAGGMSILLLRCQILIRIPTLLETDTETTTQNRDMNIRLLVHWFSLAVLKATWLVGLQPAQAQMQRHLIVATLARAWSTRTNHGLATGATAKRQNTMFRLQSGAGQLGTVLRLVSGKALAAGDRDPRLASCGSQILNAFKLCD